jgi:hypothetical protein
MQDQVGTGTSFLLSALRLAVLAVNAGSQTPAALPELHSRP